MRVLVDEQGNLIKSQKEILHAQYQFYAKLYKRDESISFKFENTMNTRVTDDEIRDLDTDIPEEEFTKAVRSLKQGKTPGIDGLTAEFYQFFWSKIKNMYIQAIRYAKMNGKLHLSATRGIITLIPKKSKDNLLLQNWHPLTMLTMDYKILAKVLATRLKEILPNIISENQTGFMEGCQISNTIRTVIDITKQRKN